MGQVAFEIFAEAEQAVGSERTQLGKWAVHSQSAAARKAALECARSIPGLVVHPADFDPDGWLLNCLNGTIDLRLDAELILKPHDPADLIRRLAPVEHEPDARSALWERVLCDATGRDPDFLRHLRRFLGSSLTADTGAELAAIAIGPTMTGKTTVLGAVRRVLGDYAADVRPDSFYVRDRPGGTRDDLMRLEGVRLALIGEADRHRRMDEGLLKSFVSGESIPARGIYQRDRELVPVAKLVYHTNELPRMTDSDDAVWRRALIWPFEHRPDPVDLRSRPRCLTSRPPVPPFCAGSSRAATPGSWMAPARRGWASRRSSRRQKAPPGC